VLDDNHGPEEVVALLKRLFPWREAVHVSYVSVTLAEARLQQTTWREAVEIVNVEVLQRQAHALSKLKIVALGHAIVDGRDVGADDAHLGICGAADV